MTDEQQLSVTESLMLKLRNREKAVEEMAKEIQTLKNANSDESAIRALQLENKELKEQVAGLQEQYRQTIRFTKGERREVQRDEQVARLTEQLKNCEIKNKQLSNDNETLINKYHAELNRNKANNL